MMGSGAADALQRGAERLGLDLGDEKQRQLLAFIALLEKWNRVFNLTAVKDPVQMVVRHVLDSLAVLPYIKGMRILDVGSGAGLPGIPLAIAKPELRYTLLDKQRKKVRFMRQAVTELDLGQVEVVESRVENYAPASSFDTVIARAFASLADMLTVCGRLCADGGRLLAMKGRHVGEELQALPPGFRVVENVALRVPGLDAARHVVVAAPADRALIGKTVP
jgi:16S rRNA (guanine527-N7)-methyltransferase